MSNRLDHPHLPKADVTIQRPDRDIEALQNAMKGVRFGEIRVVIQDGLIIQIDRTEKHRLR